jgi:Concanavalin A-like lectin/glucanases superfamily
MTLSTQLSSLATAVGTDVKNINTKIGDVANLSTLDKSNIVAAINEVASASGGGATTQKIEADLADVRVGHITDSVLYFYPFLQPASATIDPFPNYGSVASNLIVSAGTIHVDGDERSFGDIVSGASAYSTSSPGFTTDAITMEGWIKVGATTTHTGDLFGGNDLVFHINHATNALYLYHSSQQSILIGNATPNQWYHLAFVQDGAGDKEFRIYFDGTMVATGIGIVGPTYMSSTGLCVGSHCGLTGNSALAEYDDLCVSSYAKYTTTTVGVSARGQLYKAIQAKPSQLPTLNSGVSALPVYKFTPSQSRFELVSLNSVSTTISLTMVPVQCMEFTLILQQTSGSNVVLWDSMIKHVPAFPGQSTQPNQRDFYTLKTFDYGMTWYCFALGGGVL